MSISERRQAEFRLGKYRKLIANGQIYYSGTDPELIDDRIAELKKHINSRIGDSKLHFEVGFSGDFLIDQQKIEKVIESILPEAFAIVSEVVRECFGWTVFESQLLAAAAMQRGRVIELDTGEGKTLVAVFVAFLRYLAGQKVHVLTFNDYLAERDALWMKPLYDRLGMQSAYIIQSTEKDQREKAYAADVLYITAKEAGFDFLRGFLAGRPEDLVQQGFGCAIVDEADSILIDEARIPLVLAEAESGPGVMEPGVFALVKRMRAGVHFIHDRRGQQVLLTESGQIWLENCLGISNLYESENTSYLFQVRNMLQALHVLRRDIDYIIRDDKVELVDEFTGRIIKDRQWPDGLHEAVELKESITARAGGRILNRITLRDFLGLYPFLCGMTGTAVSSAREFRLFYDLGVTRVPPHIPCVRVDQPDIIFSTLKQKDEALVEEIRTRHEIGQPILIGTASVEESERLAEKVKACGLNCSVLNARHDKVEAEIIAGAGKVGAITISTNMAGRGVDIVLENKHGPGLLVIGTNRHRSIRIDRQLRGRAGRQGDPGESVFYLSLEDDLIERYRIREVLPPQYARGKVEGPIADKRVHLAMAHTQRVVEGQLFQQRQNLLRYAMLLEEQRRIIYKLHHDILTGIKKLNIWQEAGLPEGIDEDSADMQQAQQHAGAIVLSRCWADYLEFVDQLLDHVSLIKNGPTDSLTVFNRQIIDAYTHLLDDFEEQHIKLLENLEVKDGKIDLAAVGIGSPPSTRSYLIDDGSDALDKILGISDMVAAAANPGFFLLTLTQRWNKNDLSE